MLLLGGGECGAGDAQAFEYLVTQIRCLDVLSGQKFYMKLAEKMVLGHFANGPATHIAYHRFKESVATPDSVLCALNGENRASPYPGMASACPNFEL